MANPQMPQKNSQPGQQNRKADVPPKFSEDTHKQFQATEVSSSKTDTEPGLEKRATEADPSLRPLRSSEVNQSNGAQWNEHVDQNSRDRSGKTPTH